MKIIITEQQYRLLIEETSSIDDVLSQILNRFPELEPHINRIKDDIEKSDCQNIEFSNIRVPGILGMALHDKLVLSPRILDEKLEDFIFVLFHEIGHEYQFKKYGAQKMLDVYLGNMSDEDGARFIKKTEDVADEFGVRKVREYIKLGILNKNISTIHTNHKNRSEESYIQQVRQTKHMVKSQGFKTVDEASEFMYNFMVEKPTTKQEVKSISDVIHSSQTQTNNTPKIKDNSHPADDQGLRKIDEYIKNGSKGNLDLTSYVITTLGNLKKVGGNLDIYSHNIVSLGKLESVDGYLHVYGTKFDSIGNLKHVGGNLYIKGTPLMRRYSEEQIRQMVDIGGEIEK
jgi:hypothetical protein